MTIENASVIDFVTHDPNRDEVLLVMVQGQAWGDSGHQLLSLQAKFNTYLAFATNGQLTAAYPECSGKAIHIQLRCITAVGERELEFLGIVANNHVKPAGIRLSWKVIGEADEHGI